MLCLIAIPSPSLPVPATAHGAVGSLHYLPLKMFGADVWSNQARCSLPTAHPSLSLCLSLPLLAPTLSPLLHYEVSPHTKAHGGEVERNQRCWEGSEESWASRQPDSPIHSEPSTPANTFHTLPSAKNQGNGNHKSTDRGSVFTGWPSAPFCQPEQVLIH